MGKKGEVMAMSIYEYNEEYVKKSLYAEGLEDGIKEGEKETHHLKYHFEMYLFPKNQK